MASSGQLFPGEVERSGAALTGICFVESPWACLPLRDDSVYMKFSHAGMERVHVKHANMHYSCFSS